MPQGQTFDSMLEGLEEERNKGFQRFYSFESSHQVQNWKL